MGSKPKKKQEVILSKSTNACWLILRCDKCDRKAVPIVSGGKILSASRYCRHCGSDKFYLQQKEDIERLDTIYALYSKDITSVRKAMVGQSNCTFDRVISEGYVSQSNSQAWENSEVDFINNVIFFDKYSKK